MSARLKTYSVIWAIFFILFNIIAFANPVFLNIFTGSFWIGYIFIVLSFLGQLYNSHVILKHENSQKIFYNMSLMSISCIALVAIFISGLLCMTVPFFPVWLSIILCAFVSGISVSILIATQSSIKIISDTDNEIETKTFALKTLTTDAEHLLSTIQSPSLNKECKKVYEALRYSDPISNTSLREINEQIQRQFISFECAVNSGDLELSVLNADELLTLTDKRNKQCKLLK